MNDFSPPSWFVKNKKLMDSWVHWYYNPFSKQHICNGDGPMYFYDEDFNFLFKEPKLRHVEDVQFLDSDLCVFNVPYINKAILYSMSKREIVFSKILRLPKNMGEIFGISSVWFFQEENKLVFTGVWREKVGSMDCRSSHKIFSYDISAKKYFEIFENLYMTTFVFKNKYISFTQIDDKQSLMILNNDLTYSITDVDDLYDDLMKNTFTYAFDSNQGVIAFYDKNDSFDGYTYYGYNYSKTAIDLTTRQAVAWKPLNRIDNPLVNKENKTEKEDSEIYIRKNGIDNYALNNYSEEEIIHGGYFWALDSIEQKAKASGMSLQDFIGNEKISELENILFAIGWFETEINEGGFKQYFNNGRSMEFSSLINALELAGAFKTAKLIAKGVRIYAEDKKLLKKLNNLQEEITEDYISLAVEYIKKTRRKIK